jgi:hypothetical protein
MNQKMITETIDELFRNEKKKIAIKYKKDIDPIL